MLKSLAFISVCLFLISCGQQEDKILVTGKDGLLYQEGSGVPFTGIEKGFVDNQYIEYEVLNGERHGYFIVRYANGNTEISGRINHNKYEGKWEYYYPNGKLESVGFFKEDYPSGEWKMYYPDGQLKELGNYLEGERDGEWKSYDQNGQLLSIKVFKEGTIIKDSSNEDNG